MRLRLFVAVAVMVAGAVPGAAQEEERVSRTFRLGDNGRVVVSNIAGAIVVTGGGGDEVSVEAVKRTRGDRRELALIEIAFDERPGRLEVHARHASGRQGRDRGWVDITLTVPRSASVDLHSVSGDVRATGVRGAVRAQSVSGSVTASDAPRVEIAKSVSGDVELQGTAIEGPLEASSVSGTVRLRDVKARSLEVGSVSGDVDAVNVEAERLEMKSVSGGITFAGSPVRNGRYEINSHSGDVRVVLAGGAGFEYSASTFSGSIRSDIPGTVGDGGGRRRGPAGRSLRGVVGGGGATLSITTFSGDIVVERQ